jgi:hypothetical protein
MRVFSDWYRRICLRDAAVEVFGEPFLFVFPLIFCVPILLELQVLALILLVNHVELLSGLLLFKMLHKEPKAYGSILVIVALSCFSRIVPNTSAKLLMVVVRP